MDYHCFNLFLFVARLLFTKSPKVTEFASFIYLSAITKIKLKTVSIEPISLEKFKELLSQSSYKFDFYGDLYSCAILSINTLAALSASNKSWLKISKPNVNSEKKKESGLPWKITVPSVEPKENLVKNYFIQCLCVSNAPKDFVLYVTDVKLYNISKNLTVCQKGDILVCDLVSHVNVECNVEHDFPSLAKSAVVSGVLSGVDISSKDFGDILDDYFETPKLVRVGEVIRVNLLTDENSFKSRPSLWNVSDVYFSVINLRGQSNDQEQYIVKGYTDLYLNQPVHSYLPPKVFQYIKTSKSILGFDILTCPDGLHKYFNKLKKMFKVLIKGENTGRMILLTGAKGSGKKITLKAVSDFLGLHFLQVNCFDFFGINPSLAQGKWDQLISKARMSVPCVIYLENVELLGREQSYHENARLVDIFQTKIEQLLLKKHISYPIIIVGSTHLEVSELVPAIGRLFIQNVSFDALNLDETYLNLNWLLKNSNMLCSSQDLKKIAEKIRGYIFADLVLLIQHAIHIQSQDSSLGADFQRIINYNHLKKATEIMEAAYSDSIGVAKVPKVHWEDVGGLNDLKEEIMLTLNLPIQHPELFTSGLKRSGILFYGPPGTGKTLMAKAVATECNYNFLSVKGPELMNMYVGQSEKNVREVFERAREASPCIIFFDELDSLAPRRGKSGDSGGVTDRVVSQLLSEMDGFDKNKDVFVIAATNRPDLIDPALLRPGRFDKLFYVGICKDRISKLSVLKALTRRFALGSDVDFDEVIQGLPAQVTGADLYSICCDAWFAAARQVIEKYVENGLKPSLPVRVTSVDFGEAVSKFVPSLTAQDIDYYESFDSSTGTL